MRRIVAAAMIAITSALTGCAASPTGSTGETALPVPTASASTTAPMPAVSLSTTCQLLYGSNVDGPLSISTDIFERFVAAPDGSTLTAAEVDENIAAIEAALESANDDIAPFIVAQVEPLKTLSGALHSKENASIEFNAWKASGLELLTRCERFL